MFEPVDQVVVQFYTFGPLSPGLVVFDSYEISF